MATPLFLASWVSAAFRFTLQTWSLTWASPSLFWWLGETSGMHRTHKSNPTINYPSAKYTRFGMWYGRKVFTGEWKCLAKKWQIHWHCRRQPGWKEENHGAPENKNVSIRSWKQPSLRWWGWRTVHSLPNSWFLTVVQNNWTMVSPTPLQIKHRRLTCRCCHRFSKGYQELTTSP